MRDRRRIAYRPPADEISIGDVERRVIRAILTLRAMPDREKSFLRVGSCMPDHLVEWADLVARAENSELDARPARFQPTRADIGDYLTALSWVADLARLPSKPMRIRRRRRAGDDRPLGVDEWPDDRDQKILWWVAFDFSFEQIGERIGRNEFEVKRRYGQILADCWRIANGYVSVRPAAQRRQAA